VKDIEHFQLHYRTKQADYLFWNVWIWQD
jgi:hypothetical protein